MITFQTKLEDKFLTTNYKVMYSTLYYQENLEQVRFRDLILQKIMERIGFRKKKEHYLLVRDPYTRLESFFKNKFRTIVLEEKIKVWEPSQKIFFEALSLSENDSYEKIKDKFLMVSFPHFISMLASVHLLDGHLIPQYKSYRIPVKKGFLFFGSLPITYNEIIKIEDLYALQSIAERFDLDLSKTLNSSKKELGEIKWTKESRKIVNELYHKDFEKFHYTMHKL